MMAIAALIAIGSGIAGLYLSYHYDVSSGAAIVLTCTLCFGIAWAARTLRARTQSP
jgi:manganese/iron transport system permease protein